MCFWLKAHLRCLNGGVAALIFPLAVIYYSSEGVCLMINKIIIFLLFLSLFLFSGCIPYGYETESQTIIGKRSDAHGKICEQIVRYNKNLNLSE
jgi:hypothetical protein